MAVVTDDSACASSWRQATFQSRQLRLRRLEGHIGPPLKVLETFFKLPTRCVPCGPQKSRLAIDVRVARLLLSAVCQPFTRSSRPQEMPDDACLAD